MRKLMMALMVGMIVFSLAGCEAARGAGKDIENTGKNIQETVEKND